MKQVKSKATVKKVTGDVITMPTVFDEGVLQSVLSKLYKSLPIKQLSDPLEAINLLLARYDVKGLHLEAGCGVEQVRCALGILVEEHNKCVKRQ